MIKKVFILANPKIPAIKERIKSIEKVLKSCGKSVESSPENVDLIITMGGDGTFLKGVHLSGSSEPFIYGIKYGNVGFLTNSPENVEKKLEKILNGKFLVKKRLLLDIKITRNEKAAFKDFCLNEAFISKRSIRIMEILVKDSRETIFKTRGDGLIVSTPTGSTAHALSAMGPIVTPEVKCFIVIPASPHTISWRPVILPSSEKISVHISQDSVIALDGQREFVLRPGDKVLISSAKKSAHTIMDEEHLFKNLQSKFNWPL